MSSCPADAAALAAQLLRFEALPGVTLHIVPGVRLSGPRPDVMRGEETQVVGPARHAAGAGRARTLLLPGTHSKWVRVEAGAHRRLPHLHDRRAVRAAA